MIKIISDPQPKVERYNFIYNPNIIWHKPESLEILRIELDENYTRIDFIHHANPKYKNGGWVRINTKTYISPWTPDRTELFMIKAVNIPIAPAKHEYKSIHDFLYFTLYFPALPDGVKKIDITEEGSIHPFRFRGVSVSKIKKEVIIIKN